MILVDWFKMKIFFEDSREKMFKASATQKLDVSIHLDLSAIWTCCRRIQMRLVRNFSCIRDGVEEEVVLLQQKCHSTTSQMRLTGRSKGSIIVFPLKFWSMALEVVVLIYGCMRWGVLWWLWWGSILNILLIWCMTMSIIYITHTPSTYTYQFLFSNFTKPSRRKHFFGIELAFTWFFNILYFNLKWNSEN